MKFIKIISLIIILSGNNLFSEQIMYVTAKEGLNKREEPSVYGKIIGKFIFGEMVSVQEQGARDTIDGITNYWYKIHEKIRVNGELVSPWDKYCWVFGGYLSEELPLDAPIIIGRWEYNNDDYMFFANGEYSFAIKGYLPGGGGNWSLNNNILNIKKNNGNILIAIIIINDRNNIVLNFTDEEWKLKRVSSK